MTSKYATWYSLVGLLVRDFYFAFWILFNFNNDLDLTHFPMFVVVFLFIGVKFHWFMRSGGVFYFSFNINFHSYSPTVLNLIFFWKLNLNKGILLIKPIFSKCSEDSVLFRDHDRPVPVPWQCHDRSCISRGFMEFNALRIILTLWTFDVIL